MSFTVGGVLKDAVERLTTSAGAVLIAALTVVGIIQTAAGQEIVRGVLERFRAELQNPEVRDQLTAEQLEMAETEIDAAMAELPLALGLSPGVAAAVWFLGLVLMLVVVVIAIDAFGHERDTIDEFVTDRLAWKTLNLFLGWIVFGILFVIGLVLFVIPGLLVAIFLLFFAAAIVIDDKSFFSAFSSSASVVRHNFLGTLGIIVVSIVVGIAIALVGSVVGGILPAIGAAIVGDLLAAVSQAFALALVARAYVEATADESVADAADADVGSETQADAS